MSYLEFTVLLYLIISYIGGFLNGTQVKDQGGSFVCVENSKNVTYRKMEIFHQDAWDHDYYVCETTSDKEAKNWVYDIEN